MTDKEKIKLLEAQIKRLDNFSTGMLLLAVVILGTQLITL